MVQKGLRDWDNKLKGSTFLEENIYKKPSAFKLRFRPRDSTSYIIQRKLKMSRETLYLATEIGFKWLVCVLCYIYSFQLSQKAMMIEFELRMDGSNIMIQFCITEYHMWFMVELETAWEYEGSSSSSFFLISWASS